MNKRVVALSCVLAFLTIDAKADTLTDLKECSNTKDSLVRLVCYDKVVQSLNTGVKTSNLPLRKVSPKSSAVRPTVSSPRAVVQSKTKEERFGEEHLTKSKEYERKPIERGSFYD